MGAYTKVNADWKDYPDTTTPVTAAGLEQIEQGIADAHTEHIEKTIVDAKGDLIVATAADVVARLAAGANDTLLVADSAQAAGLKYAKLVNAMVDDAAAIARGKLATVTNRVPLTLNAFASVGFVSWRDAQNDQYAFSFVVPTDYVSGDITASIMRRGDSASGTAVMSRNTFRFRNATAFSQLETSVSMNFTPGNTNTQVVTMTVAAANFQAGDVIRWDILRSGSDGGDTMAASVAYDGGWVEYTGRA